MSDPSFTRRLSAGPTLVIIGALAIGYAAIGLRLSDFGPQATGFWRFLLALPMLYGLMLARGVKLKRPSLVTLAAGLFFGLDIALWHTSLTMTSVANATFLVNLGPASVGLLAWAVMRHRPPKIWFFALPVALVGALMLSLGAANAKPGALTGDMIALAAALMVGTYVFLTALARREEDALNVMFWATVVEVVVAFIASGIMNESLIPRGAMSLMIPFSLALVAQVLGQGLIAAGVGRTPAAIAGLLLLLQPVTGALLAWLLFRESLTLTQAFGAVLVLAGVWLAGLGARTNGAEAR